MDKLTPDECHILADVIGDKPTTVIPVARLTQGTCDAYLVGTLPDYTAALIFDTYCMEEPLGFGTDTDALWQMLKTIDGWSCVNVNPECAKPLGRLIEIDTGASIRYYGDVYHVLKEQVRCYPKKRIHRLQFGDTEILAKAPLEVQGNGYNTHEAMLKDGIVAAAVIDGNIVAIAHTYAETTLHADIGVSTLEQWRGKGFATAAASLVAQEIQARGKVPVWSCGEDNTASLRVAQKLGFAEVDRRTYVIPVSPV